jgi:DHA2 family lincomycin resistance protein-like MFS transporter
MPAPPGNVIVTGYALTFGSLLLFGGRVGDLVGHRRVLLIGLGAFGVTSLAAGLSPTSIALIVSRSTQGASAAFVAPQASPRSTFKTFFISAPW